MTSRCTATILPASLSFWSTALLRTRASPKTSRSRPSAPRQTTAVITVILAMRNGFSSVSRAGVGLRVGASLRSIAV
jgi:hypothetical protein